MAYGVTGSILLFRTNDGTASLGLIKGTFTADYGLALGGSSTGFATDLSDSVPVVHNDRGMDVSW